MKINEKAARKLAQSHGIKVSADKRADDLERVLVSFHVDGFYVSRRGGERTWSINRGIAAFTRGEAIEECVKRILAERAARGQS
jgi:hypothetical protein